MVYLTPYWLSYDNVIAYYPFNAMQRCNAKKIMVRYPLPHLQPTGWETNAAFLHWQNSLHLPANYLFPVIQRFSL
jgi:hypothetical protein